ncbi:nucleoporin NUP42 [Fusarium pseudocircinatum]|uniref:Nucleoporin NUP42 n=1 Tax=Fusarium pseudocircinatum TaxID=56676 RepID=A0A8H5PQX2_9HYPO|nr:nucleoporin NUP42 [Fusarium pseudocircinatum]
MTLCKFFQQGNCKFGNSCRFEHVNPNNRNQPSNRFGALGGGSSQNPADKYNITIDTIEKDLTNEVPQWILSAYAPGRDAPGQLFGGYPREQSFEELRLHFMMGKASGNEQQALNEAQELYAQAQQQMQTALRDVKGAIQFIGTQGAPFGEFLVGKRPKSTIADTGAQPTPFGSNNNASSPFGGGASAGGSAFGQPSTLGAKPSAFGAPSFGQPSQPAQGGGSVFGQPSQTSAFGQPSQLGQPASAFGKPAQTSTFGQPSQPGSAFGQPSALGAKPNPFGTPAFGQPSQPNTQGSVFGQPSQPNTQGSAFGQPSQINAQGSAFGQASQLGQKPSPFGAPSGTNNSSSPFGAVANNNSAPAANPFGAPGGSATTSQPANPFGSNSNNQNNAPANPFGQPSQPAQGSSPFGQPSNAAAPATATPFGASNAISNQTTNSPFGQPSQTQSNGFASQNNQTPASNPFGQAAQQKPANPFGQPSNAAPAAANPFATTQAQPPPAAAAASATSTGPYPPNSSRQHPPIESYSSKGMDGRLSMFKGKSVIYKDGKPGIREFDGTWRRIWFPDGPPAFSADTELAPEMYDDKSKAQWMAFAQTGTFEGGLMPELPPPRECTLWDF